MKDSRSDHEGPGSLQPFHWHRSQHASAASIETVTPASQCQLQLEVASGTYYHRRLPVPQGPPRGLFSAVATASEIWGASSGRAQANGQLGLASLRPRTGAHLAAGTGPTAGRSVLARLRPSLKPASTLTAASVWPAVYGSMSLPPLLLLTLFPSLFLLCVSM